MGKNSREKGAKEVENIEIFVVGLLLINKSLDVSKSINEHNSK